MTTLVLYTPEDRVLNLGKLSSADEDLITSLHGEICRRDRTLVCLEPSVNEADAELFIRFRFNKYEAVHFSGGGHGPHPISRQSDEHRRQKDYWQRAAEDAGYEATQEFNTGNGTILDVAIIGERRTGIEVQHSSITTRAAKTRSTKSHRAGWSPVWFYDADGTPAWSHEVPALGSNPMRWSSMPGRRTATARGLSEFVAAKCEPGEFPRCPAGNKRFCGSWHPQRRPWGGLVIDDVAAKVPAGEIVAIHDLRGRVHLVSRENRELFRMLTGKLGDYDPGAKARRALSAETKPCTSEVHVEPPIQLVTHCECGQELYSLKQLPRFRPDLCEACRIKLGLPGPPLMY